MGTEDFGAEVAAACQCLQWYDPTASGPFPKRLHAVMIMQPYLTRGRRHPGRHEFHLTFP